MGDAKDGRTGHVAGIGLLTLVLLWPALWSGAPTAFLDTVNYYASGGGAVGFFLDRTGLDGLLGGSTPGEGAGPAGEGGGQSDGVATDVRSVPYSVFVNVAMRVVGPMATVVPMALVTAWLIWLMAAPLRPSVRFAVGTGSALATTMPFYAAQIMPDIQAAWLIAIPLVVMRRDGRLGPALSAALLLAAVAAILVHYSHIPLAAATGTILGVWFLARRRPGAALVAQLPLVVAVAINLAMSVVIAGTGGGGGSPGSGGPAAEESGGLSVVPGRVPVLLARLFEDGAAIRYLTETCPENGFAICEVYDDGFPDTSREVLWGEDNVRSLATPAQMRRVTAEEMALAREVILYAPLAQIRAMARNTGDQFLRIGFSEMRLAGYEILGPLRVRLDLRRAPSWLMQGLERVQAVSVSLSALALLALAWRVPALRAPVVLLAAGLLANAFVCGALSAPAGRYQGRIVWLVVTLALVCAPQWSIRRSVPPVRT